MAVNPATDSNSTHVDFVTTSCESMSRRESLTSHVELKCQHADF